ncbi:uncharacterized protein NECHADRAFT_41150 [Fusarium vanettenii 77-13-4]|uniref:NmrA-like domain-containing protein n=1 Tax=Fusarium vanettenii (strain ATCC MYA-4622 / CBS 123669 / FGSC 9596 / NRRL 45880 / 77-13-4) TaxID=660122 RepID=C7YT21_FUSV7|nr:uncharacterized protein NECHADRAFT_41150 [Fusarium vanettenii 77-13-4]EEU45747.1 hypothetical protein NECHADRAFT_41150 [Fusarium vanettenii 77-13-4]
MSKILAVFGATGQQGGSVINYVLNDQELSQKYKVRAITRDVNSAKAKELDERVEVVQGDAFDLASLEAALVGVHTVFAMTTPVFGPDAFDVEYNSAKRIADVAVEKGVQYIVFSTLPSVTEISGGKYTKIVPFDAKAKAEQYIRSLPVKSAFYRPGSFMENFHSQPFWGPRQAPDGTWVISTHMSPQTRLPLIDAVGDSGKFVGAVLAEPEKFQGKTLSAATRLYSLEELAATMSKVTGQKVVYEQITPEEFAKEVPIMTEIFVEAFQYYEEFGYFGPDSESLVAWAAENARGKLSTLEEFLKAHPPQLS